MYYTARRIGRDFFQIAYSPKEHIFILKIIMTLISTRRRLDCMETRGGGVLGSLDAGARVTSYGEKITGYGIGMRINIRTRVSQRA